MLVWIIYDDVVADNGFTMTVMTMIRVVVCTWPTKLLQYRQMVLLMISAMC